MSPLPPANLSLAEVSTIRAAEDRRVRHDRRNRLVGRRNHPGQEAEGIVVVRRRADCAGGCHSFVARRSSPVRLSARDLHSQLFSSVDVSVSNPSNAHLACHNHLGPETVHSRRAVEADHRIRPESRTGPDHAADQARQIGPEEVHVAAADHCSRHAVEQARAIRSRADPEGCCRVDHQVGMMWAVRCLCMFRPKRYQSRGCNRNRYWKACYANND